MGADVFKALLASRVQKMCWLMHHASLTPNRYQPDSLDNVVCVIVSKRLLAEVATNLPSGGIPGPKVLRGYMMIMSPGIAPCALHCVSQICLDKKNVQILHIRFRRENQVAHSDLSQYTGPTERKQKKACSLNSPPLPSCRMLVQQSCRPCDGAELAQGGPHCANIDAG